MSGLRCAHWSSLDVRGGVGFRDVVDEALMRIISKLYLSDFLRFITLILIVYGLCDT